MGRDNLDKENGDDGMSGDSNNIAQRGHASEGDNNTNNQGHEADFEMELDTGDEMASDHAGTGLFDVTLHEGSSDRSSSCTCNSFRKTLGPPQNNTKRQRTEEFENVPKRIGKQRKQRSATPSVYDPSPSGEIEMSVETTQRLPMANGSSSISQQDASEEAAGHTSGKCFYGSQNSDCLILPLYLEDRLSTSSLSQSSNSDNTDDFALEGWDGRSSC